MNIWSDSKSKGHAIFEFENEDLQKLKIIMEVMIDLVIKILNFQIFWF